MVVFLGSWAMMFAALFFAYGLLRLGAPVWPPIDAERLPLLLPGINTAILIVSSVTLQRGIVGLRRGEILMPWLLATLALGITFMALQMVVWSSLWAHGFRLSSGHYGSVFYLLTVFHGLHVLVGIGLLFALLPFGLQRLDTDRPPARVRLTAMFWHFVDVVWALIFLTVYVL
jgi:cytochrome c oxidase subunit 3